MIWRLVYGDGRVIILFDAGATITASIHEIEEFEAKKLAETRIDELRLDYDPEMQ